MAMIVTAVAEHISHHGMGPMKLPLVRNGERVDHKRCPKKWFWRWRMGLVPRAKAFGALELGTWVHAALGAWYGEGHNRVGNLVDHFTSAADDAMADAIENGAPEYVIDKADELTALGEAMMQAYERRYGKDKGVYVIAVEIPLEFSISATGRDEIIAIHKLKPDMVYADPSKAVRLMENKTAAVIRTGHLPLDDQARPYGAMAERALKRVGVLDKRDDFAGITYNFLRKALPDERLTNEKGLYLNKNGSVSKKQPPPLFLRHPVPMTSIAKQIALRRIQRETLEITHLTLLLRNGKLDPADLPKTPHTSCEKFCPFFTMCVAEEQGTDITEMRRAMFVRQDPYQYAETTDVPSSFEMG